MRHRRDGGVLEILVEMPWWVSVLVAGVAFILMKYLLPGFLARNIFVFGFAQTLQANAGLLACVFLFPALASCIGSAKRRRLLDRQSGVESIRAMSWRQFEMLCGEAFRRKGYSVHENGLGGADDGIDLILRKNGETCLVQCKHWKRFKVGVKEVRELYGIVAAERAARGIFITAGSYTAEALRFAEGKVLDLMDGEMLLALVKDVQREKTVATSPAPPSTDPDRMPPVPSCPRCGSRMIQRTARRGHRVGSRFWGCTAYPKCHGILEVPWQANHYVCPPPC